jgi:hypothetical protein
MRRGMNERTNERTTGPQMLPETLSALRVMAGHVAESMVAEALSGMLGPGAGVTVTIHPVDAAVPRQLGPAPADVVRRGRKPGPKAGQPRKNSKGAGRVPRPAARRAAGASPAPQTSATGAVRTCRKCFKRGPVVPIDGKNVRCGNCMFAWAMREKRSEAGAVGASPRPPRPNEPSTDPKVCRRCDHDKSAHIGENGRCLSARCGCPDFYRG